MALTYDKYLKLRKLGVSDERIARLSGGELPTAFGKTRKPQSVLEKESDVANKSAREFIPKLSEQDWQERPYQTAISQTLKEGVVLPAMDYANQLSFNIPRAIIERQGMTYPQAETGEGQVLQKGAGIFGAFSNPIAKLSGLAGAIGGGIKKALPSVLTKARMGTEKILEKVPYQEAWGKVPRKTQDYAKLALGGAGYGAAYTPEMGERTDLIDLPGRAGRAIAGAFMGPVAGMAGQSIAEIARSTRRLGTKLSPKTRQLPVVSYKDATKSKIERATEKANLEQQSLKEQILQRERSKQSELEPLSQEQTLLGRRKIELGKEAEAKISPFKKAEERLGEVRKIKTQDLKTKISEQKQKLQTELDNIADANALNIKQKARTFRRNVKDNFKNTLEEVSNDLESKGKNATVNDVVSWADDIANEMSESGNLIDTNKPLKLKNDIVEYIRRKNPGLGDVQPEEILSEFADTPIDFTWLKNRMGLVKKSIQKSRLEKGALGQEDLMEAGLNRRFSDWASAQSDEYAQLLTTSKKGYDVADKIDALAQPGKPFDTVTMSKFLKDYAKDVELGRTTPSQEMVDIFEKGVPTKSIAKDGGIYNIKETPIHRDRRIRQGYTELIEVDAKTLKDAIEKRGEPIDWSKERLKSALERPETDSYPIVTMTSRGIPDVTDGGHRIAAAAQRGQRIIVSTTVESANNINKFGVKSNNIIPTQKGISGVGNITKEVQEAQSKLSQFGKTSEEQLSNLSSRYDKASKSLKSQITGIQNITKKEQDNISSKILDLDDKISNIKKLSKDEINKLNDNVLSIEKDLQSKIERIKGGKLSGTKIIAQYGQAVKTLRLFKQIVKYIGIGWGASQMLPRTGGRIIGTSTER